MLLDREQAVLAVIDIQEVLLPKDAAVAEAIWAVGEAEATWVAAAVVVTANLFSLLKLERPVCFGRRAFFLALALLSVRSGVLSSLR